MRRFTVETEFAATLAEFEALLDSPELHARLERAMPGILKIEPLARDEDERAIRRRVRYQPNTDGKIPAFGRAVVKPSMLAWIEESTFDKALHRFEYRILPNLPEAWRDRFESRGSYQLAATAGGVKRRIEGEIHVRVPLVGGAVEKLLVKEVEANFRAESAALIQWIAQRRA
jgi:hypothetical protein